MSTRRSARGIAWHESAHAAAFLELGWPPRCVRVDQPAEGIDAQVAWGDSRPFDEAALKVLLIATLAGPSSDGENIGAWWPDSWPEDTGSAGDARHARVIAQHLGFEAVDWHWACFKVVRLSRTPRYRALQAAIAGRLERVELLLKPELVELWQSIEEESRGV